MSATSDGPSQDLRPNQGMLRPAVTLILLFGLTFLSFQGVSPTLEDGRLAVLLGFVLLAASVAGTLAASAGLPRITGFILVGIAAGPSALALLPPGAVEDLRLIDRFALALIALLAGGELRAEQLRPQAKTILVATGVVTLVVWAGMTGYYIFRNRTPAKGTGT